MEPLARIILHIILAGVLTDTSEKTVENMLIGVVQILAKTIPPAGRIKINISVIAVQDGLAKYAMLKWSAVKMLQLEKVYIF